MGDFWRQASAWSTSHLNKDTSKVMSKSATDAWTAVKGVFGTVEPRDGFKPDSPAAKDASGFNETKAMGEQYPVSSGAHADGENTIHPEAQAQTPRTSCKNSGDYSGATTTKRYLATKATENMTHTNKV